MEALPPVQDSRTRDSEGKITNSRDRVKFHYSPTCPGNISHRLSNGVVYDIPLQYQKQVDENMSLGYMSLLSKLSNQAVHLNPQPVGQKTDTN